MFVSDEVVLDVSIAVAKARLVNLARGGSLRSESENAYNEGITLLVRVGPLGPTRGLSRLVEVHFLDLVSRADSSMLALRWEAEGPGGGLFPALDADITLTAAGEHATLITLAGAYRAPLGILGSGLDTAILHRVAAATIRTFLSRVADAIAHPVSMTEREMGRGWTAPSRLPRAETS
jgi:hypothetical protein